MWIALIYFTYVTIYSEKSSVHGDFHIIYSILEYYSANLHMAVGADILLLQIIQK